MCGNRRLPGPLSRPHAVNTPEQAPFERQREHDGVIRYLLGAIVRHIADRDTQCAGSVRIDVVEAHAGADDYPKRGRFLQ